MHILISLRYPWWSYPSGIILLEKLSFDPQIQMGPQWITRSSVQYYEYPILELTKQNKDIFVNMECPQAPTAED